MAGDTRTAPLADVTPPHEGAVSTAHVGECGTWQLRERHKASSRVDEGFINTATSLVLLSECQVPLPMLTVQFCHISNWLGRPAVLSKRQGVPLHHTCVILAAINPSCVCARTTPPGVPTVWLNLLQHVSKHNLKLKYVKRVCIAGSAPPRSMIEALEG